MGHGEENPIDRRTGCGAGLDALIQQNLDVDARPSRIHTRSAQERAEGGLP
jgi:hypothetical protein